MDNHVTNALDAFPFVIQNLRRNSTPAGFTPAARLIVQPALRAGGLLKSLPDKEARTLLALLTFISPNGHIGPTASEVAEALGISVKEAQERLKRLSAILYQGEPLVRQIGRAQATDYYTLSPRAVAQTEGAVQEEKPQAASVASYRPAGRDAVIAHSRAAYGIPRAEAERMVAEQLGHATQESEDTPEGAARRQLVALGVSREDVEELMTEYPLEEIEQQLAWLPYRHAKFPARLIVAAIENRYEPPARVRLEEAIANEEAAQSDAVAIPEAPPAETDAETVSLPIPQASDGEPEQSNG